ncbi:MAG TPA: hypothetical protein VGV10_02690 [Thermoleophilaceae bacterium]|nr:hypothetical protein [Thermoleophilaceae bacterium]
MADQVKSGVDRTVKNVDTVAEKLREQQRRLRELALLRRQREAQRRVATPRQAAPGPDGTGYVPPLHGTNPHGQGTATSTELPPQAARPQPNDPSPATELVVVGRSRGEQLDNGTYRGHITTAALAGNDIIPAVTSNPGQGPVTSAPLADVLTPICNSTQICLTVLNATSTTTPSGSTNSFSTATVDTTGTGIGLAAGAATSNGNISEDANCQAAHGDSNVADARLGGPTGLRADAIEATNDSRECKDGTRTNTATSKVVNLNNTAVVVPPVIPAGCGNGTPNTPALINVLLPAVCNADDSNGAQAAAPYGVREGLTTFVLATAGGALSKITTAAAESRARKKAQCSDGVDNDGDGRSDFPADPDCTGPTDDSEAGGGGGGNPECSDGVDNDGDGQIDFPADPDCSSANDDSEAGAGNRDGGDPECDDGRDNDGDGKVDFPDDPGCSSRSDDSEDDAGRAGTGGGGGGGGGGVGGGDDSQGGGGNNLAFTGTNVVLAGLIGALLLLTGLGLRSLLRGRTRPAHGRRGSGLSS